MKYYDSTGKKHKYLAFAILRTVEDKFFKPLKEIEPAPTTDIPNLDIDNISTIEVVCMDGNIVDINVELKTMCITNMQGDMIFDEEIPKSFFNLYKIASKFKKFGKK